MCIRVLWLWHQIVVKLEVSLIAVKLLGMVRIAGEQISDIIQLYNSDDILMIMMMMTDDD